MKNNDWIVTFDDGKMMVVKDKELVVNVSDYVITNTKYKAEDIVAINLLHKKA